MRNALWAVAAALCACALSACGEKNSAAKRSGAVVNASAKGEKAPNPSGKAATPGGLVEATPPADDGPPAPEGFPTDVPLPKGGAVVASSRQAGAATVHVEVAGEVEAVAAALAEKMKTRGWADGGSVAMPRGAVTTFRKNRRTATVSVVGEGGKTTVHVVVEPGG
ncbi:MAG TPA: hypothetical protein PLE19_16110 [Planctomycetota bacterium]|nr:hypothetical protein [Planctomycetota bacterium]HRR80010.1 hypothetical protein [Planctomycetota bacterium]HRT97138.1 hypothetical protein [Planctomycetota bacterium]